MRPFDLLIVPAEIFPPEHGPADTATLPSAAKAAPAREASTGRDIDIEEILRASPVFGMLDAAVLDDLVQFLEIQHVHGGSMVIREGDPSEFMIIVLSGRLRVSRRGPSGDLLLYNEICPGDSVGETGLILKQKRTADVTAVRDTTIAVLSRASFEALLHRQPIELNRVFAQAIFNHLRHTPQSVERKVAQTFAVIPLHPEAGAGEVAAGLAKAFSRTGRARHLSCTALREVTGTNGGSRAAGEMLNQLEKQVDYLIFEAESVSSALTQHAFRQADQLIFVASPKETPDVREVEKLLAREPGFSMKRQHLALLHPASALTPADTEPWLRGRTLERVYPLRRGHDADFRHLARFLTGNAVGVVLGGGGARGFAHIGVLRALEESGIPIDLLGGNSMGALIGAQYACNVPLDDILERTKQFALGGEHPTLPLVSLLAGRRIERDLQRMFEGMKMTALWRPYFAAACNLTRGCTTVQENGPLWRAVLASNSPAGLLPPVVHDGQLLVDGAILDNVPVDAMRMRLGTPLEKRRGNGTIIAIDVDVRDDLGVDPALPRLSPLHSIKRYFSRSAPSVPGIGDILYRASHIGSLHQRDRTMALADHYLEPPVSGFALMDYRRAEEIADTGYRYAREQIEKWDRAITSPR
ncbi:patatin-like phospholipase family protein [Noviherbaspirillum sp. ST9]|uniref:patatin-like phospholipase family protein n=1 Tax=Noviherbaspirillum sp. ST9 TaxID=3401606 RepID=UPI003B5867F1